MPEINGVQVQKHGSGYQVTVSAWVGAEEPLGKFFAHNLLDRVVVDAGALGLRKPEEDTDEATTERADEGGAAGVGTGTRARRRSARRNSEATPAGEGEAGAGGRDDADGATREHDAGGQVGAGARRRRRRSQQAAEVITGEVGKEAGASPSPSGTSGTAGRTRRRRTASSPAEEAGSEAKSSPTSRRRTRSGASAPSASETGSSTRGSKAGSTTTKSPSKDYSDADLSKAASQAASKLGTVEVMEVLKKFGVAKVNELKGAKRAEFVTALEAANV